MFSMISIFNNIVGSLHCYHFVIISGIIVIAGLTVTLIGKRDEQGLSDAITHCSIPKDPNVLNAPSEKHCYFNKKFLPVTENKDKKANAETRKVNKTSKQHLTKTDKSLVSPRASISADADSLAKSATLSAENRPVPTPAIDSAEACHWTEVTSVRKRRGKAAAKRESKNLPLVAKPPTAAAEPLAIVSRASPSARDADAPKHDPPMAPLTANSVAPSSGQVVVAHPRLQPEDDDFVVVSEATNSSPVEVDNFTVEGRRLLLSEVGAWNTALKL